MEGGGKLQRLCSLCEISSLGEPIVLQKSVCALALYGVFGEGKNSARGATAVVAAAATHETMVRVKAPSREPLQTNYFFTSNS